MRLSPRYLNFPNIEDFWDDCEDEFEVRKRDWVGFNLKQICNFKMEWIIEDIKDDESDLIDPFYFEKIQDQPLPTINWTDPEVRDIKERTSFVIKRSEAWFKKRIEKITATKTTSQK